MYTIAIVGAGFSGTMTAVHLLRGAGNGGLRIILIERKHPFGRGLAYDNGCVDHVLNVPAGNMSALEGEPDHFLHYCQRFDAEVSPSSFLPRQLYGDYLEWVLAQAAHAAELVGRATLATVRGEVVDIAVDADGLSRLMLSDGAHLHADRVVLACGHFPPGGGSHASWVTRCAGRLVSDPWASGALNDIDPEQPVLLVGTGHTAVDLAMQLGRQSPRRVVYALSRHGLLPQSHREPGLTVTTAPQEERVLAHDLMLQAPTVRAYMRTLRHRLAGLTRAGRDWRDAIASLRAHTPALWARLSLKERARFLRHARTYWDIHRHRLAPGVQQRLNAMREEGRLNILAGRIEELELVDGMLEVHIRRRGCDQRTVLRVSAVLLCLGANAALGRIDDRLIRKLLQKGTLGADPLGLGMALAPGYAVMDAHGTCSRSMYYIGPFLGGLHWEATAVPELRGHAQRLAHGLLAEIESGTSLGASTTATR